MTLSFTFHTTNIPAKERQIFTKKKMNYAVSSEGDEGHQLETLRWETKPTPVTSSKIQTTEHSHRAGCFQQFDKL